MTHQLYNDTLELLKKLIRNACVNDFTPGSGQEERNAATLAEFFGDAPLNIRTYTSEPGRTTIVAHVRGTGDGPPLTFMGHTDVVPADETQWSVDPFAATIRDGKIYGRGAVDMLFLTATMAAVTRHYAYDPPAGDLYFVGLADEEARGGLGAQWLLKHHPKACSWDHCISETGGAHLPHGVTVYVGEKGAAQRRLTVSGDTGHGSAPYGKESAVVRIGQVAQAIADMKPEVTNSELWEGFVRAFGFDEALTEAVQAGKQYDALGELAAFGDAISHLTISPTVLRAGQPINVLPSSASLELDIRTLPGQSDDDVDALLQAAVEPLGFEVGIERLICEEASVSPTGHPLYEAIERTFEHLFPTKATVPVIAAGGSDLRFARRAGGVGYGFAAHLEQRTLGHIHAQLHSHDEYLHLEDLDLTIEAYDRLVQEFCGTNSSES